MPGVVGAMLSRPASRTIICVNADVLVREVAGVNGIAVRSAAQRDANRDFRFFHDALTLFFSIAWVAATVTGNQGVPEPKAGAAHIQIVDTCVADGAENTAEIGVRGEERCLYQRRMSHGIGDF